MLFLYTKLCTSASSQKIHAYQMALQQKEIPCKLKSRWLRRSHPMDSAVFGGMGGEVPQMSYSLYVKHQDLELAKELLWEIDEDGS